jgi:hypothetical protein
MECIFIASGVTFGVAIGVIGGMSIHYRRATPASVLTPIPGEWYARQAEWLLTLPKEEAEKYLAMMGPGVAATVRSYMHCTVCNEAA